MTGRWAGSNRRSTLPSHWPQIRARILRRDQHRCRWPGCTQPATDVDHIGDPLDHTFANLRSLCGPHHDARSSAQGNAARWQHKRTRPPEEHPGRVGGTP